MKDGIGLVSLLVGPDSAWFWTMVQAFAVTITLYLIYRQLRVTRYSNMLDTLSRLDASWGSETMIKARHDVCTEYCDCQIVDTKKITHREGKILDFFEEIGIFLKLKVLDKNVIWESYSYSIDHYWQMLNPKMVEFRASTKDVSWYDNFDSLAVEMRKISKKRKATGPDKNESEMRKFCEGEIQRLETAAADSNVILLEAGATIKIKQDKQNKARNEAE